jgi:hypothetical protein
MVAGSDIVLEYLGLTWQARLAGDHIGADQVWLHPRSNLVLPTGGFLEALPKRPNDVEEALSSPPTGHSQGNLHMRMTSDQRSSSHG